MTVEQRAALWAATADTGLSSKAIMATMLGNPPSDGYCYPHDGSDLARCVGLLDAVPEWRTRIGEMAGVGPEWAALAARWDDLEAAHKAGDHAGTHRLIQSIVRPIERNRPGLVNLGGGMSIYFPGKGAA